MHHHTHNTARARWAAEYREARKVRTFARFFRDRRPALAAGDLLGIEIAVDSDAYEAAGRVFGLLANWDELSRPLWIRKDEYVAGYRRSLS